MGKPVPETEDLRQAQETVAGALNTDPLTQALAQILAARREALEKCKAKEQELETIGQDLGKADAELAKAIRALNASQHEVDDLKKIQAKLARNCRRLAKSRLALTKLAKNSRRMARHIKGDRKELIWHVKTCDDLIRQISKLETEKERLEEELTGLRDENLSLRRRAPEQSVRDVANADEARLRRAHAELLKMVEMVVSIMLTTDADRAIRLVKLVNTRANKDLLETREVAMAEKLRRILADSDGGIGRIEALFTALLQDDQASIQTKAAAIHGSSALASALKNVSDPIPIVVNNDKDKDEDFRW